MRDGIGSLLLDLRVLYEDDTVIVIDKPAFMPTENTRSIKESARSQLEAREKRRE